MTRAGIPGQPGALRPVLAPRSQPRAPSLLHLTSFPAPCLPPPSRPPSSFGFCSEECRAPQTHADIRETDFARVSPLSLSFSVCVKWGCHTGSKMTFASGSIKAPPLPRFSCTSISFLSLLSRYFSLRSSSLCSSLCLRNFSLCIRTSGSRPLPQPLLLPLFISLPGSAPKG